ncbi:hypothetical protein [Cohnella cholangitidis]|uniref:Uncharacterized protein n=1 Tax=Cohnella cholangitidis TaxID=2598458 RepID=A0A7G5BTE5_9BACL|nr:hypothetical protein [Cohnella cholangitidis]QMV40229.1 hypothetical protein FPL14_02705 [Cohnella cholangitidis]
MIKLQMELEQVKAERDDFAQQLFRLNEDNVVMASELAAKDKVLNGYADEEFWNRDKKGWIRSVLDKGYVARTILLSYPPREKGATE